MILELVQSEIQNNPDIFKWNVADIRLAGSRVYGYYKPTSDYDIIVYMDIPSDHPRKHKIYGHVKSEYKGIRVNIRVEDISLYNRTYFGFILPKYSLLTDTITNYVDEDIIGYMQLKINENPDWAVGREIDSVVISDNVSNFATSINEKII